MISNCQFDETIKIVNEFAKGLSENVLFVIPGIFASIVYMCFIFTCIFSILTCILGFYCLRSCGLLLHDYSKYMTNTKKEKKKLPDPKKTKKK